MGLMSQAVTLSEADAADIQESQSFLTEDSSSGRSSGINRRKKKGCKQALMNLGGSVRINPLGLAVICGIVVIIILFSRGGGSSDAPVADVPTIDTVSLRTRLSGIISAAKNGGKEVKAVRSEADTGETSRGKTKEGANDPKTNGDMRSHVQMFYGIKKTFPGINIVSEEHDEAEVDESKVGALSIDDAEVMALEDKTVALADLTVWIDPLDAAQEYTEKLLQYVTTMVCVAVKGVP